jgi:hypothetical protein
LPAFTPGVATPVDYTCTDDSGNATTVTLWVMVQPQSIDPPTQTVLTDISRYFASSPATVVVRVGDDGMIGSSGDCALDPTVLITGAASYWQDVGNPYDYFFTVVGEGMHSVTVTVTSACSGDTIVRDHDVGIDVTPPTFAGYNQAAGAPRTPSDLSDDSLYQGYFVGQSSPSFQLLGNVSDNGCGIESIVASVVQDPQGAAGVLATAMNELPILGGTPQEGPVLVANAPCTDLEWCDINETGIEIPASVTHGPYRIDLVATDCAGNSATRELYFYALNLDLALLRMDTAINRFLAEWAAAQPTNWVAIQPALLDAQSHYLHARAANRQEELPTADMGIDGGYEMMSDVLGFLAGDKPQDEQEIADKLVELATGVRSEMRQLYVDAQQANNFADLDQAALADTRLQAAQSLETTSPGAALMELRRAAFHLELSQDPYATGALVSFNDAVNLLGTTLNDVTEYVGDTAVEPEMYGGTEMLAIQTSLEDIRMVMRCTATGGSHPTCVNQFTGSDPDRPTSEDLAINVLNLMLAQSQFEDADLVFTYTDNTSYTTALAATVAVNSGLNNSAANICGGETHPLIQAARAHWEDMEVIRQGMADDSALVTDYQLEATTLRTRCLVMYVFNAAYISDTIYVDFNWFDPAQEDMNLLSIAGCDPPGGGDATLQAWYDSQDIYDDVSCACSGTRDDLYNPMFCP